MSELLDLDAIGERLARVLELATADETEVTWIEASGGSATAGSGEPGRSRGRRPVERTVLVRAREGHRRGSFRTGSAEPGEILLAVRQAVAASRAAAPMPALQLGDAWAEPPPPSAAPRADFPADPSENDQRGGPEGSTGSVDSAEAIDWGAVLWDDALARLDPALAADILRFEPAAGRSELLTLDWRILRVVVASSSGLDRRAEATVATLSARSAAAPDGDVAGGGAGSATASARTLAGLDPSTLLDRARERCADRSAGRGELPGREAPVLFAPEAAAALVAVLVRSAFASSAYESERSPIAGLLGEHVFAAGIDLVDDGLAPEGLPFPFDLLGRSKERIALVTDGVPRTPAVDELLAARLQRSPTPHAVGPEDARPTHPFLLPRRSADEVLAAAEGGLWIPSFDGLECFDRGRIAVRGHCLSPRRIRAGALAEPVPPVVWEDSLLRLFSKVRALGGPTVVLAEDGGLGGVSAPMVCVEGAGELRLGIRD